MKRSLTFPFIFRSAQKYPTVCFQAFAGRVQQSTILTRRHVIGCKLTTSWTSSQADLQPNFWDFCPFLREREREMDGGQTTSERGKSSGQRSLATPSSLFLFSFLLHISLSSSTPPFSSLRLLVALQQRRQEKNSGSFQSSRCAARTDGGMRGRGCGWATHELCKQARSASGDY